MYQSLIYKSFVLGFIVCYKKKLQKNLISQAFHSDIILIYLPFPFNRIQIHVKIILKRKYLKTVA